MHGPSIIIDPESDGDMSQSGSPPSHKQVPSDPPQATNRCRLILHQTSNHSHLILQHWKISDVYHFSGSDNNNMMNFLKQ